MRAIIHRCFLIGCSLLGFVVPSAGQNEVRGDWRLELLAAEKLPHDTDSLLARNLGFVKNAKELEGAVRKLGAATQGERQQAQSEILLMGRDVLPQLRALPDPKEPEVRLRLQGIQRQLEVGGKWNKDELLRLANAGLLHERQNQQGSHPSQRMFVELFRDAANPLPEKYRSLRFVAAKNLQGRVADGQLIFPNQRNDQEGDQRLMLDAKSIMGKAAFPRRFRIDVKLGGRPGGEGNYHLGVSVGNVRALYHPGYDEGGFRFEQVSDHKFLKANQDMGFTPSCDQLQAMTMEVEVLANGMVKLDVTIRCHQDIFRTTMQFPKSVIGEIDQLSLDRSGRDGGDAVFDDWIIEWQP